MDALPEDAKMCEFVGLPSVFGDPEIMRRLKRGELGPSGRAALWKMESERQMTGFARFQGRTKRTLGPADGLSREYVWGPREFTVLVDPADIRIIHSWGAPYQRAFTVHDELVVIGRTNRPRAGEEMSYDRRYATV